MIERIIIKGYRLFKDLDMHPNKQMNIVVGDNEAGKSTLLEALSIALTGRVNGKWAQEELNPYWFNREQVLTYFTALAASNPAKPPEILIELYLDKEDDSLQTMRGIHNSQMDSSAPGIQFTVKPSPEYAVEFSEYLASTDRPGILPVEYYEIEWKDFADQPLKRRPKGLGVSIIDSRTIRSSAGVDYHTREMLKDFVEPKERAAISVAHRRARHSITTHTLGPVNERIADMGSILHDRAIGLQMDQSASASWETSIVPQVADIPFAMAGQGQQAAIKVALAINRSADSTAYALIEEPENHLSHTSLTKLVARIENLAGSRQVFLTTHSSYVLNRLGLDTLLLLHRGHQARFDSLPADTVSYFKKLSGYDTLRLVLAQSVVLVEGPSDEMVFARAFADLQGGKQPIDLGIDVVSMKGVSLKRGLQLCAALDRKAAALRDNDNKPADHWQEPLSKWLEPDKRELFIGDPAAGATLEPQIIAANDDQTIRKLLDFDSKKTTEQWMSDHKTEWSLRVAEAGASINYPPYILDAIEFIA